MTPGDYFDMRAMVERHEKDLYRGNGKPGMTTRMEVVETGLEGICRNLRTITWLIVGMLLTLVGDLIVKAVR